jgi:hypothetical protein
MAFRECANASYFTGVAPFNPVPIGTVLNLTDDIVNVVTATNVNLPLFGAGYTLPVGTWIVQCGLLVELCDNAGTPATPAPNTQLVNSNLDMFYNSVEVANSDWGYFVDATTSEYDIFKQHMIHGAVVSTGGANLFNIILRAQPAGGQFFKLDDTGTIDNYNYVTATRVA